QPDTTQPDTSEPDTTEPDATEPDATEPDATEPDVATDPTTATTAPPSDQLPARPSDEDGVSAAVESGAPSGGDGNGDGTPDAEQANVASLPSKYDVDGNGSLDDYITIESPLFTSLANVRTLEVPADNPPPNGAELPAGLIDYDVHVVTPGDHADVKLFLPDGSLSAVYMFQNGQWSNFSNRAQINDGADEVTLELADGGAGDQSGTDGVIHDPVGVGTPGTPGTITANKVAIGSGAQTFDFRLQQCTNSGSGTPGSCTGATSLGDRTGVPGGDYGIWNNLTTGSLTWYFVTEINIPAGWTLQSVSCTGAANSGAGTNGFFVRLGPANTSAQCTFTDRQQRSLTVTKQTTPDGTPGTFPFRLEQCTETSGTGCTGTGTFLTPDPQNLSDNGVATWGPLLNDTNYRITETLPSGWTLTGRSCTGGEQNGNSGANGQVIRLTNDNTTEQFGDCTFTNTQLTLNVTKQTVPDAAPGTFPFRLEQCTQTSGTGCTGTGTFLTPDPQNLSDGGTASWVGLLNDTNYRITETLPTGWTLTGRSCTGGEQNGNSGANGQVIRLTTDSAAESVGSCTFTNTGPGSLLIKKAGTRTGGADPNNVQGLSGATFGVYSDAGTTTLVTTCTPTDGNGECLVNGLSPGTYWVKELGPAPAGYTNVSAIDTDGGPDSDPYVIEVDVESNTTTQVPPNDDNSRPRWFVNRANNNPFPEICGVDITLVLDRSGSMQGSETAAANAAKAFTTALNNTPTKIAIRSFSTTATTNSGFISLANNGKPNVDAVIDAVYGPAAAGSTNWDDAFRHAAAVAGDVVVTITDGNPTVRGVPNVGDGGDTDVWDVEQGVISANNVKAAGATSIAIGVGGNVSAMNLDLISSPDQSYLADNFSAVTDLLLQIAQQTCGGSITVTKKVKVGNDYVTATQPTYPAFTFQAVNPTPPPTVTPSGPVATNASGSVSFSWNSTDNETITVTEVPPNQNGYTQNAALTECELSNGDPVSTATAAGGITVQNVAPTDIVNCTFYDDPVPTASIQVVKNTSTLPGGPFTFSLSGGPTSKPPVQITTTQAGLDTPYTPAPAFPALASGVYTVTEGPVAGWELTSATCDNTDTAGTAETVPAAGLTVAAGQHWLCTFTNTTNTAHIEVVKHL
ncbi:MAG: choice-of-anchor U domain-containing protein, partial [Acidimicrobiia bacterium]